MRYRLKCENPGDIEYTLIVTATAKEWEEFRDQLANVYPSWKFSSAITDLLAQARKIYWPSEGVNEDGEA